MRLAPKIFLPVALALAVAAAFTLILGFGLVRSLQHHLLQRLAQDHEATLRLLMDRATSEATSLAAVFVRLPEVEAAYRLALSGNPHDEADPKAQEARQMLRRALAPMLAGFEAATGAKLKLHFHLPTNRSLVRLWRKVNFQRGDQQLDISDDISRFRQTVVQTNQQRRPQRGLEVGVGGFDLRSVLPITAADGTHLGSVEVLVDLGELLEAAARQLRVDMAVFMHASLLPIAVQLQDAAKYPRLGGFVQVRGAKEPEAAGFLDPAWLEEAARGRVTRQESGRFLAASPIQDFSGTPVGVLVLGHDTSDLVALLHGAGRLATAVVFATLGGILLVIYLTVRRVVLRPLAHLTQAALLIRDGNLETEI